MNEELVSWDICPTKKDLQEMLFSFIDQDGKTVLQKYITLKALKFLVESGIKELAGKAKSEFISTTQGVMESELYGVKISLRDMSRKAAMSDPSYSYSETVKEMEANINRMKIELEAAEKILKTEKAKEIQLGIAVKEKDLIDELYPEPELSHFDMVITLRKQ